MKRVPICLIFLLIVCSLTTQPGVAFCGSSTEGNLNAAIGPPSQLRLIIADNGFELTWKPSPQDPGMVTGYEIVRSDEFAGPYERIATVNEGVREYLDKSAATNIVYFYKVRAMAGAQHSHFSNIAGGERPASMP